MDLKKYFSKRNFKKTPEPKAKKVQNADHLSFVVQKHNASHLHYDFRLEYKGVLLSWAIPKGPSLDPKDKRLAIHVEDHPLSYGSFEGIIPEGNYGAGTVKIWDKGTYQVEGAETKKQAEKILQAGLKKGHLQFEIKGKKLKGRFDLVHLKNSEKDNLWLLIKKNDEYAVTTKKIKQTRVKLKKAS